MAQIYKIFINEIPVIIREGNTGEEMQQYPELNPVYFFTQKKEIQKTFDLIEKGGHMKSLTIIGDDARNIRRFIFRDYTKVKAAGGLVYNDKNEILMIFRHGMWDLPKGKIDAGERKRMAALREVREETGLRKLNILKKLGKTYHTYTVQSRKILKVTHWYLMLSDDMQTLTPQHEEGIEIVKWVNEEDLPEKLKKTWSSIREVITNGVHVMHLG